MQNIDRQSIWKQRYPWSRKVSLLTTLSTFILVVFTLTISVPSLFSDHHEDDNDPREEIAIGAGFIAAVAGGAGAIGGIIFAGATAPVWVPVATGIGIGAGIIGGGVALWDLLDGPEDDCFDCDGSGYYMDGTHRCPTCNPGDDDSCPNCPGLENGGGCSTCQPPVDNTPTCYYCTDGCSMCDTGAGGYYWRSYQ